LVSPTDPFGDATFTGGAFVTAGDMDLDGRAEIVVTPDEGGGPRVVVFDLTGTTLAVKANFFGIDDTAFRGGARAALGDVNGDGPGGGPRVLGVSGSLLRQGMIDQAENSPSANFFAFDGTQRGGVRVAAKEGDADADRELVVGSGDGQAPAVVVFPGKTLRGG